MHSDNTGFIWNPSLLKRRLIRDRSLFASTEALNIPSAPCSRLSEDSCSCDASVQ